jgi:hypothetical protein
MVDAHDSKSCGGNPMRVQVSPPAHYMEALLWIIGLILGYLISVSIAGKFAGDTSCPTLSFDIRSLHVYIHHWIYFGILLVVLIKLNIYNPLLYGGIVGIIVQGLMYRDRFEIISKKFQHNIPFFSQLSKNDWQDRGFSSLEEATNWENKSCGMACLKMIFDMHGIRSDQSFASLIKESEEKGIYKTGIGCIHQGIADECNAHGIEAERAQIADIQEFKLPIDQGHILIVSIGAGFEGGKKSGHLVPVIGYIEKNGKIKFLIVHHTSSWESRQWPAKKIDVETFMNHFSGNAIRVKIR